MSRVSAGFPTNLPSRPLLQQSSCHSGAAVRRFGVVRRGIPDRFIEHAERGELLADLGLDVDGLCRTVKQSLERPQGMAVESEF